MQRARWRRNKQAARAKAATPPVELPAEFVAAVTEERDRRASREFERAIFDHPALGYWTKNRPNWVNMRHGSWRAFTADVWAASALLNRQWGKATPTMIARWLVENGRGQSYKQDSLRPMVYRALAFNDALGRSCRLHADNLTIYPPKFSLE